ncbi:MAG: carbamoyltransferase [Acidobacteria bacterium]|nr:carbamoyltransferase [Acidobacteriota bacterium]
MNILGISGQERDAAAALVQDGKVVAAIEEEKLSRVRHIGIDYAGGLPAQAIAFCLQRGGINFAEVDAVAYYLEPQKLFHREMAFRSAHALDVPPALTNESVPEYFVETLNSLRERLKTRQLAESKLTGKGQFIEVNHQQAHAASAFYASGFERAAIIIANNKGDMTATSLLLGDGAKIESLNEAPYPHSLGLIYNAVTAALGFGADAHKTMWLSATGKPEFIKLFQDLLRVKKNGLPAVNDAYLDAYGKGQPSLAPEFFDNLGVQVRAHDEPINQRHREVAASLQAHIEDVLCEMATRLREKTNEANLCLAGGVALNSLAMAEIERRAGFTNIFVQPAAGNAGCAMGAALSVWHQTLGNSERHYQMQDVFLGPQYGEEEIKSVLDNCKIGYEYFLTEDKLIAEVARLLAQGKIIGWFRGAMEFGGRALGNRSILASPVNEYMRDNLNTFIKHREDFRPFSAAVPEERLNEFCEPSHLTRFLEGVSRVRNEKREMIPAALFGEGLARMHSVNRKTNPAFWKLLTKFDELTQVPVLLNTSFNLFGEPVVSTPREAVRGFYCSGIDGLAIGNFLVKK